MPNTEVQKILIVDDDERFRDVCKELSLSIGLETYIAGDGIEALELIEKHRFTIALVDLKMPRMSGLDFLYHAREIVPELPVIIITGYGSIESAVEAMKLGAVDYITKPSSIVEIRGIIKKTIESWKASWRFLKEEEARGRFGIIGRSKAMQSVYERIEAMCNSDNTVLIMG